MHVIVRRVGVIVLSIRLKKLKEKFSFKISAFTLCFVYKIKILFYSTTFFYRYVALLADTKTILRLFTFKTLKALIQYI